MNKLLTCLLICCSIVPLWAQNGSYFLSHHAPGNQNFDNVCFDMAQDQKGVMYFAIKAGILEFDGREWDLISGTGAVYSLNRNDAGEIFWAGTKGFGRIGLNKKGFKQIHFLSDSSAGDAFQTLAFKEQVYFLTESKLYSYKNGDTKAHLIISASGQSLFTGIFELFGTVYVQTERNIIFKVENNKLLYVNLNLTGNVIFNSRIDNTYLLGTSDNKLFICDENLAMRPVPMEDQPYADANVIVSGTWINKQLLALGTLRGGVMLLNPITGQRDQIIDYSTGLPDNEVFSLMADANQNIWVAHEYGFTQISPTMPFRSFSYYSGLNGNMLCAYSFRSNVYVGTSVGLFKLDKEVLYDEVTSIVDVEIKTRKKVNDRGGQTQSPTVSKQPSVQEEAPSKKGGFFNFLKRNRKKDKSTQEADASAETKKNDPIEPTPEETQKVQKQYRKEKKVDRILRSTEFVFKKVSGIDAKVTHLVETDGKLIAAGLGGIFEVQDLGAQTIMQTPTRYLYASVKQQSIIASTYNDEIWSLQSQSGWQQLNLINSLGDQIEFIFEGAENEWWLCGLDRIYQLQLDTQGVHRLQTIELSNPKFEKTVGINYNNQIVLVGSDGFFHFDREKNKLKKIDSLPTPSQYFALDGNILYRDQHRWNLLGSQSGQNNLQLLNLFQNLRFIATDQNPQNLWMISGSNDLFKFYSEKIPFMGSQFPIFIKSIQNNSVKSADFSHLDIDQLNSAVTFEVVQPDFINPKSIEFRYLLQGMNGEWSEWSSTNNKIYFPYLPPGEYSLQVEAKNIFGKISSLKPLPFEVTPPYWKRPLFYAFEFLIFASLVILSFRLSTQYRIISRLLSLITIILLIEFIQTAIGSSIVTDDSPVMEFFIQVIVALLILPVEGFLRNLMLRSLDSSSRFYTFISAAHIPKLPGKKTSKNKVREHS
ncbi:MAG: triple tyrosine motif-containing protein [Cyclobacteriaceae bacterium]